MPHLVYLHGLGSSPGARKAALLRERLEPEGFSFTVPDLNVPSFARLSFAAIAEATVAAIRATSPAAVVGSSLGGLAALAAGERLGTACPPLLLVAPAVGFGERWLSRLPPGEFVELVHHAEGRTVPVHRAFFEEMAALTVGFQPPPARVGVVSGTRDESVPIEAVRETWSRWLTTGRLPKGSFLVEVEGGDHGLLDAVDDLAGALRRLLG